MEKIILASNSERRKMLLTQAGIPYVAIPSNYDESEAFSEEISPYDLVSIVSREKAEAVAHGISENAVILGADTIISLQGRVIGKPKDEQEAYQILKSLQGKEHSVYTGVCIIKKINGREIMKSIVDTTTVRMRKLTDEEIKAYIATGEPFDKAGSYAIQEKGLLLIESIKGDYYNVVGMPLVKIYLALSEMGIDITNIWAH